MDIQQHFDFCVCGNGMVGSVAALALAQRGYRTAWIAPEQLRPFSEQDSPDIRMSAISLGSVALLTKTGVWDRVVAMRAKPYTDLRVWENDGIETAFAAKDIGESCLGYFVENRLIQLACAEQAKRDSNLQRIDAPVKAVLNSQNQVLVELADGRSLTCLWVIGAEGAQSKVRQDAGIATRGWQYKQQAMGIIVELEQEACAETWQQFFPSGPRAFLPMYDNFAALIWYDASSRLDGLLKQNDENLLTTITAAFPARLPQIKRVLSKAKFPLTRMHANDYVKNRTILVGDAAHTVNPLAGQGVNMGFGDIKALMDALDKYAKKGLSDAALNNALHFNYGFTHKQKNRIMMTALEAIYQTFKQSLLPVQLLRNTGLLAAQHSGLAKAQVIKFAAGLE